MAKFTIGELSKLTKISKSALRFYDEKGLLKPEARQANNYRLYSERQAIYAVAIRELKQMGFSMADLKELMHNTDLSYVKGKLEQKIQTLRDEIPKMQQQLEHLTASSQMLSEVLKFYEETDDQPPPSMSIDEMPETTVIYDRRICNISAKNLWWERLNDVYLLRDKLNVTTYGPISAILHEHFLHQFFFEEGDMTVYMPIRETERTDEHIAKIGGHLVASMVYVGWYENLLDVYVNLVKQIKANKYRIIGPPHEEYLATFSHGVPKERYVTRIFFPVEPLQNSEPQ
ncbi:MerR family transcriptional regulator [Pyramidobacter piscolens]|uniref:MerR family transcriptional regulator n=2 Tax=Pyramidobacter piscolens TaxID=638849 RepID=UPI00258BE43F|nr:MerR family transcriptional regulator [Pyramidobacter piscolens]